MKVVFDAGPPVRRSASAPSITTSTLLQRIEKKPLAERLGGGDGDDAPSKY
jgi:hypothetical protein